MVALTYVSASSGGSLDFFVQGTLHGGGSSAVDLLTLCMMFTFNFVVKRYLIRRFRW
jgi:hypothetical protein